MKLTCLLALILAVANCRLDAAPVTDARIATRTNAVAVLRTEWRDAKRDRAVPVKIYYPQTGDGPLPVIIFSHGLGGSREGCEYLGRYWASHGYVSAHLQHPGSDEAIWRDVALGDRMSAMRRAVAQPQNALNRPQDVSFAIDELAKLNATNSPLRQRLDLDRIGMAGHSFGAHTTLIIAGETMPLAGSLADPRVKAAIPMSSPVPANRARLDELFAGVKIPCLHMTGTKDASPIGDTKAEERRLPFDHCKNSDQFLITFTDGDHMIFSGRERRSGGEKDARFHELICESSTAFWDAYLRGNAPAKSWLTNAFKQQLGPDGTFEMKLHP